MQEFSASTSGCGAIYQAEIDFLPEATRKQMLINYLADFFDFKGNKDVDDEVAWGELSKGSKACIDALKSMFADCEHFKSTASTEAFLMTFKGHNDSKLHGPLCGRLKEYMSGLGIDMKTNKIIVSADGAGKLAKALDPFMKSGARLSEDGELQPSLWPIVRHVRYAYGLVYAMLKLLNSFLQDFFELATAGPIYRTSRPPWDWRHKSDSGVHVQRLHAQDGLHYCRRGHVSK